MPSQRPQHKQRYEKTPLPVVNVLKFHALLFKLKLNFVITTDYTPPRSSEFQHTIIYQTGNVRIFYIFPQWCNSRKKTIRSRTLILTFLCAVKLDTKTRMISSSQRPLHSQHSTNTRDEHPFPHRDSNPRPHIYTLDCPAKGIGWLLYTRIGTILKYKYIR